jgi:hypothetical protein
MILEDLIKQAKQVLRGNDAGDFTPPSSTQYPHQWNWDSAFIALGLSHFDLPRAQAEVRSLLRAQWRDGMLPHIIYHERASEYFPPPDFGQTQNLPHSGAVASSGLTQPPILATIIRTLHERVGSAGGDSWFGFLREVFPCLRAWHRWLHTARDADGTGLPCLIHPWESGMDNSPQWSTALDRIIPTGLPPFKRRDTMYVSPDERPLMPDYERFVSLIDQGRRLHWEPGALLERMPFLIQDVMFCSILYRADEDLRALALILGEETREVDDWLARTRRAFDARFWNEARGIYFDYDARTHTPIPVSTCATFMPLFAGLASATQAERLVAEHLTNPAEYAPGADSRYRLPSAAKNEPDYSPRRYWCGPVWINMNWLIADGLRRYGFNALAQELDADSLALMQRSGLREYYDPRDGTGCGATQFSWSAALALEMGLAKARKPAPG